MHYSADQTITPQRAAGIKTYLTLTLLLLFSFLFVSSVAAGAAKDKPESPKRVIVVKDYKWASGGMGRPGILSEITLENRGKMDYKDIDIELDLYTTNDIPLGSLRSTIHETLPSGSEKTFYNVKFGIMHAELQNTVARVVGAELIERGTPTQAKDLIQVKDWEWSGGQYGTEGILKSITLVNKSRTNWKDIKIRVDFLGLSGGKVGVRGFTSRAVIHNILPAGEEQTYKNINVGFRHPDAKKVSIHVMSAKPISEKETTIAKAKKEGKKVRRKKKKKGEPSDASGVDEEGLVSSEDSELSLSERYKKKLAEEQGLTPVPPAGDSSLGDTETVSEPKASTEKDVSVKEMMTAKKDEPAEEPQTAQAPDTPSEDTESSDDDDEYYEYEEDVPLPKEDLVVEDFEWGGGVTGMIGTIRELTINNISSIGYTKIDLKVMFFSYKEETPMYSNRITIYEIIPPDSKKTFKNIKAGYLNAIPQEVRIEILDAVPMDQ